MVAAVTFGIFSFLVGYFGPLYLLKDAGVGPISGFFFAPAGIAVGTVCSVVATGRYVRFIVTSALVWLGALILVVVWQ
jgi:hypothetical protein